MSTPAVATRSWLSTAVAEDWSAPAATALFEQLVGSLEGRALAHAAYYGHAEG